MRRIVWAATAFLVNAACRDISYPPPPQRAAVPHRVMAVLDMTGGRPEEVWGSIVSDVASGDPSLDWRWTRAHPRFRFTLDSSLTWTLNVRLTAVEKALASVGTQHVTFTVNGKTVGTAALERSRLYDLTFPVDKAVFGIASPAIVGFDVEPCQILEDGMAYCVLIHSVALIQESLVRESK